jgi:hypothetical protein
LSAVAVCRGIRIGWIVTVQDSVVVGPAKARENPNEWRHPALPRAPLRIPIGRSFLDLG